MASDTPYNAKGAIPPPESFDSELGSAISAPPRDLVPKLASRTQALQAYDSMVRTDAVCSVSLRATKVPTLGADFYIDPIADDPQAEFRAEFVKDNLFGNITVPFSYVLTRILKNHQHGSSVLETVMENRMWAPNQKGANRKNYTMLRKLAYRPGPTISKIEYDDNGGPKLIHHNAHRADGKIDEVKIPIEKAIIFPIGEADDYLGDSILRSAYQHWYYKTYLYKIDAIQKERHGVGVPVGELPPGASNTDKDNFNQMLANVRANERGFVTLRTGYKFSFADINTQLVDVLKSANHHDILIMLNTFSEFMMLGLEASGGGRATSGAQTDLFFKSVWFVANSICDYFNMFLIPNLILYNFEVDVYPQLKVRNIGQSRDMQQLAAALANLAAQRLITVDDTGTENWTRSQFDMPKLQGERPKIEIPSGVIKPGKNGNDTVSDNGSGGQGNMKKDPTQA